ncbi:ROLLING AND ERECT LEAF 2-like protein, partial [Drosera capensis]
RVAAALRDYVEGDEPREFLLDSCITPPSMSIKKSNPKCFSGMPIESEGKTTRSVLETPQSPETVPIQSYSPLHHYGMDGFFTMQDPSRYSYFSADNRPNNVIPPRLWDSFWNPFSPLDYYGYPVRSGNLEKKKAYPTWKKKLSTKNSKQEDIGQDNKRDMFTDLRQLREEEGIPDLEEETEHEELETRRHRTGQQARHVYNYPREGTGHGDSTARSHGVEQRSRNATNQARQEVTVEDIDEVDDDDDDDSGDECEHHTNGMQPHAGTTVSQQDTKEESPGFTAYVKKRLTSMDEVIKDLEEQFMTICSAANEVSALLEFGRAQYSSPSSELSAMKMLNPVALFQSASSRSSSSRFFWNSSSSRDESSDSSSSDFYEESSMVSGSHQSTVGKLFAWEKRLRRSPGEKIRLAYEKVCNQLKSQDVKGDDPSAVDKTRAAIRDLHTQIKVSIRSIEAVSKRIEAVRDKELQPQISELVLGYALLLLFPFSWYVPSKLISGHAIRTRRPSTEQLFVVVAP